MRTSVKLWAILALAGSVSAQALAHAAPPPVATPLPTPQAAPVAPPNPAAGPPRVQPGAQVALAHALVDAAGAFDGYVRRASAIKDDFHDGMAVQHAVDLGGVYEPGQLQRGAIAYAALVALQDRNFVAAVQEVGRDPQRREAFVAGLIAQPRTVLDAGAARKSAARVAMVLGRMGAQVAQAGAAINQAAYDVQSQDWSRAPIVGVQDNLVRVKARSVAVSLAPGDTEQLIGGLAAYRGQDSGSQADTEQTSATVTRGMALAALAILGKADENDAPALASLMSDPEAARCLERARLDLFQCLAVVGPHYENLACLGRHAMFQTGRCIVISAGMADIVLPAPVDRRSILIPVAVEEPRTERDAVMGAPAAPPAGVSVPMAAPPLPEQRPAAR